jgi:nitric oxide reductase NorE protein
MHLGRFPGEPGMWIFLLGDMAAFAVLFGVFLHGRSQDPELFRSSQELPCVPSTEPSTP